MKVKYEGFGFGVGGGSVWGGGFGAGVWFSGRVWGFNLGGQLGLVNRI